jgi:hypothetical protein
MQLQRGVQLGALQQQLGIDPNARVTVDFKQTITIDDVSTGTHFEIFTAVTPIQIIKESFAVPEWVNKILSATDAELKKRYQETEGWDEERETIFAELTCRGIRVLNL